MILHLDTTHVSQGLIHAELLIPVKSGPLTLDYPKWLPGEHSPSGSTMNIAGLTFASNGQILPWRRDLVEHFQFHLTIPKGASSLVVSFDYIDNIGSPGRDESDQETTPTLAMISFWHFLFYPDGLLSEDIPVSADIMLPSGWQYATAMEPIATSASSVRFRTESLYTVMDSPIMTGAYIKKVSLTAPGTSPSVEFDLGAESPDDLVPFDDGLIHLKSLVQQETTVVGSEHYRHYNFLAFLTGHLAEYGLEHEESSEDGLTETALTDGKGFAMEGNTFAHEYFHSWNGKYRRPADLARPEFITPQQTDLLWVYEGLTQYYGSVFSVRAGFITPERQLESWASLLDSEDHSPGRSWRSLQDTADDAPEDYYSPGNWSDYRRGTDFYGEAMLDWLGVDAIIRKQTNNRKSLDSFCQLFYSQKTPQVTTPFVKPYVKADIITALNKVCPYNWQGYWDRRLNGLGRGYLDKSLSYAGWSLTYNDTLNIRSAGTLPYTAGFHCAPDGSVTNVVPGSIAFAAGLAPGLKIIAIDGRPYTKDVLDDQLNAAKTLPDPIQLICEEDNFYSIIKLDYHGGIQFPHLQRIPSTPDLLTQILAPRPIPQFRNRTFAFDVQPIVPSERTTLKYPPLSAVPPCAYAVT
jgi:predicted metalloprotease with PDZ domain